MSLDAIVDHGPLRHGKETWARPRRMSANDGNSYIVKVRNGEGSKSFFNEFVASNLARIIGPSAIEPVIINLSSGLIEDSRDLGTAQIKPGLYYATRCIEGAYASTDDVAPSIQPHSVANIEQVPAFVVFDVFVNSKDRHGGNALLIRSGSDRDRYKYLLIDHGHCFGGPKWSASEAANLPYEVEGVPWFTDGITGEGDFREHADRMANLDECDIDAARAGLPDAWDVPAGDYKALRCALSSRSPDLMLDAVRAGRAVFSGCKRTGVKRRGA